MGICEGGVAPSEDVDMDGSGAGAINTGKRRIIVGGPELNFKRDAMEI